jgi:predicted secreted hydrolase
MSSLGLGAQILFERKKTGKPKIGFPEDEGAHPDFPVEWWYGHFSLTDSRGKEYGAMVAYFIFGLKILSISDLAAGQFHQFASGSALHNVEKKLDLRWGHDHWFRTDEHSLSYKLESYGRGLSIDLALISDKPPLPGSGKGMIKWLGEESHYYSLTRLKAKGRLDLQGDKLDVNGIGWMDHLWTTSLVQEDMDRFAVQLGKKTSLSQGGWDWFAVQLDNNTELVFWRIVRPDESIMSYDLTIMFPDDSIYNTRKLTLDKLDSWVSPESGREYGVLWRVRQKARGLDLQIEAWSREQEIRILDELSIPLFCFWEGRTSVSGYLDGKAVSGVGYTELVRLPL